MIQKRFVNSILIALVSILIFAGIYFTLIKQNLSSISLPISSSKLSPFPTSSQTPTSMKNLLSDTNVSILDLNHNKSDFLDKNIKVSGKVHVNVFLGERPCAVDNSLCDTSMGAQLELWNNEGNSFVLLFKDKKPYPCEKIAPSFYKCGIYTSKSDELVTLSGIWSKDRVPVEWIGTSGGNPPKPIKWADRYFLNIK